MKQVFLLLSLISLVSNPADNRSNFSGGASVLHVGKLYNIASRSYIYRLCMPTSLRNITLVLDDGETVPIGHFEKDDYLPQVQCWFSPYDCSIDATIDLNDLQEKQFVKNARIEDRDGDTYFDGINKQRCAVFVQNFRKDENIGYSVYTFDLSQEKQDHEELPPILKKEGSGAVVHTLLLHPHQNIFLLSGSQYLSSSEESFRTGPLRLISAYTFDVSKKSVKLITNIVTRSKAISMCCLQDDDYLAVGESGNLIFFGFKADSNGVIQEYMHDEKYVYKFKDVAINADCKKESDGDFRVTLMSDEGFIFSAKVNLASRVVRLVKIAKIKTANKSDCTHLYYNAGSLGCVCEGIGSEKKFQSLTENEDGNTLEIVQEPCRDPFLIVDDSD